MILFLAFFCIFIFPLLLLQFPLVSWRRRRDVWLTFIIILSTFPLASDFDSVCKIAGRLSRILSILCMYFPLFYFYFPPFLFFMLLLLYALFNFIFVAHSRRFRTSLHGDSDKFFRQLFSYILETKQSWYQINISAQYMHIYRDIARRFVARCIKHFRCFFTYIYCHLIII